MTTRIGFGATKPTPATPASTRGTATPASPPARRRTARPTPPTRVTYTRYATAGNNDDRIVNPAWFRFLIVTLCVGGVAVLGWRIFGGFQLGRATVSPAVSSVSLPATYAPTQPTAPRWLSREDCEYHYKVVLHEAPAGRCD